MPVFVMFFMFVLFNVLLLCVAGPVRHCDRLVGEEAVLTSTNNLCFEQKYEKYQIFLSENFPFLVVKVSIYLNRHIFIMRSLLSKQNYETNKYCKFERNKLKNKPFNSVLQISHQITSAQRD